MGLGKALIPDKDTMYRLLMAGEFGNRTRVWTPDAFSDFIGPNFRDSDFKGYGIRLIGGSSTQYVRRWVGNLNECEVLREVSQYVKQGVDNSRITVWEVAPTHRTVINAEVSRSDAYFDLHWSTEKLPMRDALSVGRKYSQGLEAVMVLRRALDGPSWDNLSDLFDRYPDAVIELSSFEIGCGILGWNTLFWEVRDGY